MGTAHCKGFALNAKKRISVRHSLEKGFGLKVPRLSAKPAHWENRPKLNAGHLAWQRAGPNSTKSEGLGNGGFRRMGL